MPARAVSLRPRPSRGTISVRAENQGKVTREYREDDDEIVVNKPKAEGGQAAPTGNQKSVYVDQLPDVQRDPMSKEMREKLRKEYYSMGGAPDQKMTNWYLYIILFIGFLAISSALTGALGPAGY
ncbi:unnamed protein product [Pedinophyceae sp. YPF-701]|nr:unnamed protein product [Pedinophyceae sp. YPF-701]